MTADPASVPEVVGAEAAAAVACLLAACLPAPWTAGMVRETLAAPGAFAVVVAARARSGLDAAALFFVAGDDVEVLQVAVAPGRRRRGLARRVLADGLARAGARGAVRAFLEVRPSNEAAVTLYESLGFSRVGSRRAYYPDGEDALVLGRDLTPGPPP